MEDYEPSTPAPPGYRYGPQGQLIHEAYDESGHATLGMKGTVIPSAKFGEGVGGNVAFDPHALDLKQNIVECNADGMTVLSTTTRKEMAAKQAADAQPPSTCSAPLAPPVPADPAVTVPQQVIERITGQLAIDLANRGGKMAKKKKATKKAKKTSRRVEKTPEAPAAAPVPIFIAGPFGQISQQVTAVFRDGNLLVLATDHRLLPTAYALPPVGDTPIPITVGWADQSLACLWAGIKFTLPDGSITFMLLFANEEEQADADGEGLSGEARQDQV